MDSPVPEGFVSLPLTRRQLEIYMLLVRETMTLAEVFTAQVRAIEIIAAHDKVGESLRHD